MPRCVRPEGDDMMDGAARMGRAGRIEVVEMRD